MNEKILGILEDIKPGTDFEGKTDIVSAKLLKSLDIMTLISELEDEFDIEIPAENIVPENFESIENIVKLVQSL